MGRAMPLYGHACRPSIKHPSWIIPEAKPAHTSTRWKKTHETMRGIQHALTKQYDECLTTCGDIKTDLKLRKVTEAIYFFMQSAG